MNLTLATRATAVLVTTMVVAAPAWAQSSAPTTAAPTAPAPAASAMPSTPAKGAAAHHVSAAAARQPGESMESLVERRITDLHSKLHITPAEGQQWDQFAQVMRDNAKSLDDMYRARASKISGMSAVDNMESYADIENQRAQGVQKLVPAFQSLYASLSDQQKKTADQLFRSYSAKAQPTRHASK